MPGATGWPILQFQGQSCVTKSKSRASSYHRSDCTSIVVAKIHVRFCVPDGSDVVPSDEWQGPDLFHDAQSRVIIRRNVVDQDFLGRPDDVEKLDGGIADEIERLLRSRVTHDEVSSKPSGSLRDTIRGTLERPGALLKRMEKREAATLPPPVSRPDRGSRVLASIR